MDKKAIGKAVVSAVALAAAAGGMLGLFSGNEPLTYSTKAATAAALLDPAVQDGVYAAESTNNFSTVGAELTIADRRITDVKITSSGDADLMTDEIRSAWAASILEAQSAENDVITGATLVYSAESVQDAVRQALAKAAGEVPAAEQSAVTAEEQTEVSAAPAEDTDAETAARLMREQPAISVITPAEEKAEASAAPAENTETADTPMEEAYRLMRKRPSF